MSEPDHQRPTCAIPDGFYAALSPPTRACRTRPSELLNARLVLILANHIGDPEVLREALALARRHLPASLRRPATQPKYIEYA